MTLEECIEYFETEAETSDSLMMPYEPRKKYSDDCKKMADWLRELQEYRKLYTCHNCYNASASFSDYPCCECRRCFKALDGIKDHYEEVNADERREL